MGAAATMTPKISTPEYDFIFKFENIRALAVAVASYVLTNALDADWTDWKRALGSLLAGAATFALTYLSSKAPNS